METNVLERSLGKKSHYACRLITGEIITFQKSRETDDGWLLLEGCKVFMPITHMEEHGGGREKIDFVFHRGLEVNHAHLVWVAENPSEE